MDPPDANIGAVERSRMLKASFRQLIQDLLQNHLFSHARVSALLQLGPDKQIITNNPQHWQEFMMVTHWNLWKLQVVCRVPNVKQLVPLPSDQYMMNPKIVLLADETEIDRIMDAAVPQSQWEVDAMAKLAAEYPGPQALPLGGIKLLSSLLEIALGPVAFAQFLTYYHRLQLSPWVKQIELGERPK